MALPGMLTVLFLGSGLLGTVWYRLPAAKNDPPANLFELASSLLLAKLAWFFFITGAFTFGGGLAVIPLLEKGLVQQEHWLSAADFLTAMAVGMLTPGPVMIAATFAGYLVAGGWGALVFTLAIYLLSFLLVLFTAPPHFMRHRATRSCRASPRRFTRSPLVRSWARLCCSARTRSGIGSPLSSRREVFSP